MKELDVLHPLNAAYLEQMYEQYRHESTGVDDGWARLFDSVEGARPHATVREVGGVQVRRADLASFDLVHSYRELGHLVAELNPLGDNQERHPLLELSEFGISERDLDRDVESGSFRGCENVSLRELIRLLRETYCGTFAVEYMDISDKDERDWLHEHMERSLNRPDLGPQDRVQILKKVTEAEVFEQFLQRKYVGQKRFSLEGGESLIPMLDALVERAASLGSRELVFGMAHRGRLNVLANILGKPYEMLFSEFEGTLLPRDIEGDGDVKYHLGYSRDYTTRGGSRVHLSLCFNPSHLEAVNPVVEGIVRAKQRYRRDAERTEVIPVLMHGDAAFTGQGLVAETLALSDLGAYRTGGSIHIIIDNQVGFTANPEDYRFSRYPSDVARVIQAPVFHVNGDDPEAAVHAAQLAIEYRQRFKKDVIVHLLCYRRHGHNETDDPTFTQPLMYKRIRSHPTVRALYAERLRKQGVVSAEQAEEQVAALQDLFTDAIDYARDFMPRQQVFTLGGVWEGMNWAGEDWGADTAVPKERLVEIIEGARRVPAGFQVHPKVKKLLDSRVEMVCKTGEIDWGCAEVLALGSLLREGTHVRFSGQDVRRGTFSHRHAALRDVETGEMFLPLGHLSPDQAGLEITDTMLSEAAVLAFDYGFSTADPRNLVVWEAQFGDFANGAQVIIDQFISSAESKWQRMSGLVMLLPHGYEGQGPEHSSARLERYLQLCAENNMQVCNLTTPAQYFHAMRRQIHRNFRKPLIIMSPKSLLRHRLAVSSPDELATGTFQPVLPDIEVEDEGAVRRVLLCSGKVYYDLLVERRDRGRQDCALVRVEQLYPFPGEEIRAQIERYPRAAEVAWVQEEPWNMGAWHFVAQRLPALCGDRQLLYVGRDEAASPAPGSYKLHQRETADFVDRALRVGEERSQAEAG